MLRQVLIYDSSYVLGDGEYVDLRFTGTPSVGERGILLRDGDSCYVCSSKGINGNSPCGDVYDAVVSLLGGCSSWELNFGCKSVSRLLSVFCGDWSDCGSCVVLLWDAVRDKALDCISFIDSRYTTDKIYSGIHGYHHSHGIEMNVPVSGLSAGQHRIGVELEMYARSQGKFDEVTGCSSNWFMMERDSSLPSYGIELITVPLLPRDAMSVKMWGSLVDYLQSRCGSWDSSRCGLHVHVGRESLGCSEDERQDTLGKILFLYYTCGLKDTPWNIKLYGRTSTYSESTFRCVESDAVKVLGNQLMRDKATAKKVDVALKRVADQTRYYDINIQNSATIEFRKGKGSICVERIVAVITYCEYMIRYCKVRKFHTISCDDFLSWLRKNVVKSNPIFRYLPAVGEE